MTGNLKLLRNFVEKFMGTVRFENDHFATITGYTDCVHGNGTICHVYYVECLGHNLFSVGKFFEGDLEVAFRSKTCYDPNLEGEDLLSGVRDSNLYTISISDMTAYSPVFLMSKATSTKSWSLVHIPYNKTSYYLIKNRIPNVQYFHGFGSTRKVIEIIHVKFDELMAKASEHNYLKPKTNCFNVEYSSVESNQTSSSKDLDDLFGPLYKEYYEARQQKVSINSATPTTINNQDTFIVNNHH
nr:integrase, catalytic region, zinc finger, CCHC-type, peptidase aspartic, catalytic [Tanacetum cinerariifolium]